MRTFMVSYDLGRPGRDYDGLTKYFERFGIYWHNLDSTWLIVTDKTAAEVCDGAVAYLDSDDKLLVAQVSTPCAWRGLSASGADWLTKYLP